MMISNKVPDVLKHPIVVLGSLFVLLMLVTYQKPLWLSCNEFLDDFIGSQLLGLLSVVLTVTLASIANIHLTLTKVINDISDDDKKKAAKASAEIAREEINSNAWGLFWSFLFTIVLLVIDGHFITETHMQSHVEAFVYSICMIILVFNMWVLYDVYQSVFSLSKNSGSD